MTNQPNQVQKVVSSTTIQIRKSPKTGNQYRCVVVTIGEPNDSRKWEQVIFPKSRYEWEYIEQQIIKEQGVIDLNEPDKPLDINDLK